jgi:hypothetical protein
MEVLSNVYQSILKENLMRDRSERSSEAARARATETAVQSAPQAEPAADAIWLSAAAELQIPDRAVSEDEIRLRAYELYCARGDAGGDALGDWLAAEREAQVAKAFAGGEQAEAPQS